MNSENNSKKSKWFVGILIVLLAIITGVFLGSWYVSLNDSLSCSAESVRNFTCPVETAYGFSGDNITYYADYSALVSYSNSIANGVDYSRLNFSFKSYNKIYSNDAPQYFLSASDYGSSVVGSNVNTYPFSFSLNLSNIPVGSFNILNNGSVYYYYNSTTYGNYTRGSDSVLSNLHYYLVSSSTSSFSSIVGYTTGNFVKYDDNYLGNWFEDFINLSSLTNFAYTQIENGSWYFLSLFDSNYNRVTLFVQVGSSTSNVIDIDYSWTRERFFTQLSDSELEDYYRKGVSDGYNNGYNVGFNDGVQDSNDYSFLGLMSSVVDVPVKAFTSLFNFEVLGVNLKDFLLGLFGIAVVITILRFVLVR